MSLKKMKKIKKEKQTPKEEILGFDENGMPIKVKKPIKKGPIIAISAVSLVLGFLYLPACFKTPVPATSFASKLTVNTEMIREGSVFYKTYPDNDFDGDGITNSVENRYNTNGYSVDTDDDGLCDYAEIHLLNTSPTQWSNNLQQYVAEIDEKNGDSTGTPYKLNNVILWADDLYSKSYGGVVRTIDGYEFTNFTGWVQFAEDGYAYQYVDGIHKELKYREAENAYYIDGDMRVVLFPEQMTKLYKGEFFGKVAYLSDDFWGQFLNAILPDYGNYAFLKCYPIMDCDRVGVERNDAVLDIVLPKYELEPTRFSKNDTSLEDISRVFTSINAGKTVALSVFRDGYGETIMIVYGYTSDGDLLVADAETLEPIGKLLVYERAGRRLDENGVVNMVEWFDFYCAGYKTSNWSRLVFLFNEADTDSSPFVPAEMDEEDDSKNNDADKDNKEEPEKTVPAVTTNNIPITTTTSPSNEKNTQYKETSDTSTTQKPQESRVPTNTSAPISEQETTSAGQTTRNSSQTTTTTPAQSPATTVPTSASDSGEETIFDFSNF